jgi:hypothetical protein
MMAVAIALGCVMNKTFADIMFGIGALVITLCMSLGVPLVMLYFAVKIVKFAWAG